MTLLLKKGRPPLRRGGNLLSASMLTIVKNFCVIRWHGPLALLFTAARPLPPGAAGTFFQRSFFNQHLVELGVIMPFMC